MSALDVKSGFNIVSPTGYQIPKAEKIRIIKITGNQ